MLRFHALALSVLLSVTGASLAHAQTRYPLQQLPELLQGVMPGGDEEADDWEQTVELLTELAAHPLDLNHAHREDLEQLTFLSALQVEELVAYIERNRPVRSLAELQLLQSFNVPVLRLMPYFVYVGESLDGTPPDLPPVDTIGKYGRHELTAYGRVPFYQRKGDRNGYLGYPYKHWFQYDFSYGDRLRAGLVGAQDAGEPFFAEGNRAGYDFYSMYVQVRQWGRVETAVVGKYRLSLGMGLVANTVLGLGKQAMLQNLGRSTRAVRAYASRSSANYFQGAAATVRLTGGLTLTPFVSYRGMDGTLNSDSTVRTLITSGYHRTPTEMGKKNNLKATVAGANINFRHWGGHFGLSAVYSHLDRPLHPQTTTLYRRYYPQGSDFLNVSADYGYTHYRFSINGETAMDGNGHLATLNSLSVQLADGLSVMALQRFYSYRYTSLYANSVSDGGRVQNESGLCLGGQWMPSPSWRLQAYFDYAYFPWARYQVSQRSASCDAFASVVYTRRQWTVQGRYRLRLRQRDDDEKTRLLNRREHRARLSLGWHGQQGWSLLTQADASLVDFKQRQWGWAVTQQAGYTGRRLRLSASAAYFHTDSYDARLYVFEQAPLYVQTFPSFYGEGLRYMVMARAQLTSRLMLTAKVGVTDYFDRSVISSGLQQIDGSSQTDFDVQLRWKF